MSDTLSFDQAQESLQAIKTALANHIFGMDGVIEETLVGILAGGHLLLTGAPGLAKTTLVVQLAHLLGLENNRIQCTPDLLPADVLGGEVLEEDKNTGSRSFRLIKGPVFCQLLMADEINRASPKTQSALLQAMQEQQVTLSGRTYTLEKPFHVLATQNPLEQEGTYPLPEAQLDRFLLEIHVPYPDKEVERQIVLGAGNGMQEDNAVIDGDALLMMQEMVRDMTVSDRITDAIVKIIQATRPGQTTDKTVQTHVNWGAGPRAGQALLLCSKARALLDGRHAPSMDDLIVLAPAVLRHRIGLNYTARAEGITADDLIADLCRLHLN